MSLSITTLRNVKPAEKPYKLADEKGLFLLVQPSGGMLWRFKYRTDGRDDAGNPKRVEKKLGLGTYPDVGLKDARDLRDEARERLQKPQKSANNDTGLTAGVRQYSPTTGRFWGPRRGPFENC